MSDGAKVRWEAGGRRRRGGGGRLGIAFERMNVNFLVGWAFSVAASANLPALVLVLFWKGATRQGVVAAVAVAWRRRSAGSLERGHVPGRVRAAGGVAPVPFSQPGVVTIPLGSR